MRRGVEARAAELDPARHGRDGGVGGRVEGREGFALVRAEEREGDEDGVGGGEAGVGVCG